MNKSSKASERNLSEIICDFTKTLTQLWHFDMELFHSIGATLVLYCISKGESPLGDVTSSWCLFQKNAISVLVYIHKGFSQQRNPRKEVEGGLEKIPFNIK